MTIAKIVFFYETAPFCNFFLLKPHFSLPLQPEIIRCNAVKTTDARLRDTGRETIWPSPRVPKSRSPEVKKTMITQDQLKDLCKRIDALRRYL